MRAVLFVLLCGLASVALAATPRTALVLGDSLSAAHNIPVAAGWVHQADVRAQALTPPWRIVNASISGETTQSGRDRLPGLLQRYHPQLVVLELGANDGLQGMPLAEIRGNLSAMIAASKKAGARVLLLGIELPVNYGPRYRDGLQAIYKDLAHQFDLPLLPFLLQGVALKPALMQADGMHPDVAGERIVFDNIWKVLAPLLRAPRHMAAPAG
ncbi:MAG TPA: arylesterase [Rhodanobacteraceae bacterium]